MKKVPIIEDEHYSAMRLKKLIGDLDDTLEIVGPLKCVDEVVAELQNHNNYDLLFADIRLADGDVFDAFREVMPASFVIFTTAYDEYALQAIKHNGLDYLLKPIDFKELCAAVQKLELLQAPRQQEHTNSLAGVMKEAHPYRERFLVSKGDELKMLSVDDICYISKEENRVVAYTADGLPYPLSLTMTDLEQELNPDKFFRINRQYITHIEGIQRISLFFSSKLKVRLKGCPDDNIVVSKEKSKQLKEWLDR